MFESNRGAYTFLFRCTFDRLARAAAIRKFASFVGILCVVTTPSQAAPIVLVEFTHRVGALELGNPPPPTVTFGIEAYESGPAPEPVYFTWDVEYDSNDVGLTFLAPQEVVAGANQALASPRASYIVETGPANFLEVSQLSNPFCEPNARATVHVPDLTPYRVTSVARIIDQLEMADPQGSFHVFRGAQRVQFWGELVPEPSALMLLLIAISSLCASRLIDTTGCR